MQGEGVEVGGHGATVVRGEEMGNGEGKRKMGGDTCRGTVEKQREREAETQRQRHGETPLQGNGGDNGGKREMERRGRRQPR